MPDDNKFYNPFAFVPVQKVDANSSMRRGELNSRPNDSDRQFRFQHVTHDRYVTETGASQSKSQRVYSGKLLCHMKLMSPTVVGASQTGSGPTEVLPYKQLNRRDDKSVWEPAIPATTLRGLISNVYETASNSALRVMSNIAMSRRMEMGENYSAVGMIIGEKGNRQIVPLAFPILKEQGGYAVPSEFQAFQEHQMQLKIYLHNLQLDSFTPENNQVMFLKCASKTSFEISNNRVENVVNPKQKGFGKQGNLVGHELPHVKANNIGEFLLNRQQWLDLNDEAKQAAFRPGLVRRLNGGLGRHAWFIPLSDQVYDSKKGQWRWDSIKVVPCEEAALLYEAMAGMRTEADKRNRELPYRWKQGSGKAEGKVELKQNHLVCFQIDPISGSSDLSIAAIWRAPAGRLWDWFEEVDENLAPMNEHRKSVTLAEQLFGFVEQPRFPDGEDGVLGAGQKPAVNGLKGRLRFSSASMVRSTVSNDPYLPPATACILSSPKPPSPAMYFRKSPNHTVKGKYKSDFPKQADAEAIKRYQPAGRKQYLHHDSKLMVWQSGLPNESLDQKMRLRPMKAGLEFVFSVSFDNLSHDELSLLVYSLSPNEAFCHKLGLGKPLGLGSVRIDVGGLFLIDRQARYRNFASSVAESSKFDRHEFSGDKQQFENLADNIKAEMRHELQVLSNSEKVDSTQIDLLKNFRTEGANHVPKTIRKSLETVGAPDSSSGTPVHYPRAADSLLPKVGGKPNIEHELYRWHVANNLRADRAETVAANQKGTLVALDKRMPWFFFLYDGLSDGDQAELEKLLEDHYPGQWQREEELPNDVKAYESQIKKIRSKGFLPIHLGIKEVAWEYKTIDNKPLYWNVVKQFREKYLPQLN